MPSTFPAQPSPDFGYKFETVPRANSTPFGDGYSQRTQDGLNTQLRSTTLTFTNRTTVEKDILESFLDDQYGVLNFLWRPEGDAFPAIWYAPHWTIQENSAGRWTVTIDVREDPVV